MAERADLADLTTVDRDVRRAFEAWSRSRAAMTHDPDGHGDADPFEPFRYVAGQSTYDALAHASPSAHDAELQGALRRWVYALTQWRIGRPLDVDLARAAAAPRGRYGGDPPRLVGYRDAWRGLVAAAGVGEARLWLAAAEDAAPGVASVVRERAARRLEVAERMVGEGAQDPLLPVARTKIDEAARALLAATDAIAAAVRRESRADDEGPAGVLRLAVGRDAPEGWPSKLTARWLDETFGRFAVGLRVELPALPPAYGAGSFARAQYAFGHALRVASSPRGLPFALAREPAFVDAHRVGFVFAALATSPDFHAKALGTSRRVALSQARVLARTALFDARLHAARWILGDESAVAPKAAFEEITAGLFGVPVPPPFAGAWPRARDDEAARFVALVTALPLANELVDRFDIDWFSNPRSAVHMKSRAAVPAREAIELDPVASAASLARAFEEALG